MRTGVVSGTVLIWMALLGTEHCRSQSPSARQGIVVADDAMIPRVFQDRDARAAVGLAENLALAYDAVILHLGRAYAFRRGGLFFTKTSQSNLVAFCDYLSERGVTVYLWFLDSFGNQAFIELYAEYPQIIDENLAHLCRLGIRFDGIVVDLEWINHPQGDNGPRLLELLDYLTEAVGGKKVLLFAPLIDNAAENANRGYDE